MTESITLAPPQARRPERRLPAAALLALFLSGFAGILTEALPAGLLPEMSRSLQVDAALAGQTVTIYALATVLGAIPLARLTARWDRKHVLQTALIVVALANTATALTTDFTSMMIIRFIAGLGTAMIWPLLGGYAAALAPDGKQGRAVAIALAGTPVALALGIPLGTFVGHLGGWELAFLLSTALTIMNLVWTQFALPRLAGREPGQHPKFLATLRIPGLRTILVALAAFMIAHNIVYTYITDYLGAIGMTEQTGWVLFAFGAASILSVVIVGAHIDTRLRTLLIISAVVIGTSILVLAVFTQVPALVYIAATAWGFAFGSSPSLFVGAAINAGGSSADVAQAVTITVFSGSIAAGAFVGGLIVGGFGGVAIAWAAVVLMIAATAIIIGGRRYAFPEAES